MKGRFLRGLCLAAALLLAPPLAGCETAPATGKTFFTGGLTAEKEAQLGAEQHEQIVPQFGGAYDDPELARYVTGIGNLLAKTSELPDLKFTFTVLDSPIVNAFALPGGYVYVTRGLLALANSEAELAGVMAHEIGHVTGRHSAQRMGQTQLANILLLGASIATGQNLASTLGPVAAVALRAYSREHEFEADTLGVRYLTRAGYDPKAMAGFLDSLLAHSRLEAEILGHPGKADEFNIMQTHPRTADRVQRAIAEAGNRVVKDPMTGREIYLGKIDGMLYGDSPDQGFIRGRRFIHPKLRFAFEVPEKFRLINSASKVLATGPEGAAIVFDQDAKWQGEEPRQYLTETWAGKTALEDVERFEVDGMPAATGWTRLKTRQGEVDLRLVAFRYDSKSLYRMLFISPPALTRQLSGPYRETTFSFRRLTQAQAARHKPQRIRLRKVRRGESAATLAKLMAVAEPKLETFLVLNGLEENSKLRPGQLVKLVVE